jgi:adenine-specific DNA-methyltransferase
MDFQRPTKEEAKKRIASLALQFGSDLNEYRKESYGETQARIQFIDPFFKALGWNMSNEGLSSADKEVQHEDRVKLKAELTEKEMGTKKPDYGFYILQKLQFFVEAKQPHTRIKEETMPALQLRRYAYSKGHPIGILTDFDELAIYDCTAQPLKDDPAHKHRLIYIPFQDYIKRFDEIWDTFSFEAVSKGKLNELIKTKTFRRGESRLDKDFVQSLDIWRTALANDIFQNNSTINTIDLNFAVQTILDRIVFLRVAEDRFIEPYKQLKGIFISKGMAYQNLVKDFERAQLKYNSDLFNLQKDKLTPTLKISDDTLNGIIDNMYYPNSPYVFSEIPVEILGNAYEDFLGKTITVTPQHKIIIELKPETRKAGGVFYTPQYIVNYIVQNTVGKLVEGKTPEQVAQLTILDPSCGSGSFLIGVYQFLLDWHQKYYVKHLDNYVRTKKKPFHPDGKLTNAERKRILLNNIYGVDLDPQAIEVTKLSLLLKAIEGETAETVKQLNNAFERVLPSLDVNIRCGNSLIDADSLKELTPYVSTTEQAAINPFHWESAFENVFAKKGGFDIIVGNPPYARLQTLQEFQPAAVPYFRKRYQSAQTGNFDIYVLFIERAFQLLNPKGILGFIQPHKFFQADFGEGVRTFLSAEKAISEIVHFGAAQVFKDATTYTCLLFLDKKRRKNFYFVKVNDLETPTDTLQAVLNNKPDRYEATDIEQPKDGNNWNFGADNAAALLDKIKKQPETLADVTRKIFVGLQTSADKIYVLRIIEEKTKTWRCFSKSLDREIEIEKGLVKPFLMGKDVKKYEKPTPLNVCIFPYNLIDGKAQLMLADTIKKDFPKGWQYILENKKELEDRESGKMKHAGFYAYIYPKNLAEFEAVKVMTPDIANQSQFTVDTEHLYHTTTIYSFSFLDSVKEHQKYFLGVMNSPLMWFFLTSTGNILRGGFFRFKTEYLKPFPIRRINFKDKTEKATHDAIVKHVEAVLALRADVVNADGSRERERLEKKIADTEGAINALVYQLYDITDKADIQLIEGK